MTHIPPITREAMEHIREMVAQLKRPHAGCVEIIDVAAMLENWPLTPADPLDAVRARKDEPTPMLIWCPECGRRHIDLGEFATKPHHTHACQYCGCCWRPAIVPTVGVQFLPGFKNEEQLPSSPHAALIAELKIIESGLRAEGEFGVSDVIKRAADALEGDKP